MSILYDFERYAYILCLLILIIIGVFWPIVFLISFVWITYFVYKQWIQHSLLPTHDKLVLVTGCDSGIGLSTAERLDKLGCYVIAGCLNPNGEGPKSLQKSGSDRLQLIQLDITNQVQLDNCIAWIRQFIAANSFHGLWGLYNNAGISLGGECEWVTMEQYQRVVNVNLWGTIRITKAMLPLIRPCKGRVVTMTSGLARTPSPGRSPYSVAKYALEGFMDALRYEMKKFGVKCCIVSPIFNGMAASTQIFAGMERCLQQQMDEMSDEVSTAYGPEYFQAFKRNLISGYPKKEGGTRSVDPVVSDVCHALLSDSPRVRYKTMEWSWLLWWTFYHIFPEDITDSFGQPKCDNSLPELAVKNEQNL